MQVLYSSQIFYVDEKDLNYLVFTLPLTKNTLLAKEIIDKKNIFEVLSLRTNKKVQYKLEEGLGIHNIDAMDFYGTRRLKKIMDMAKLYRSSQSVKEFYESKLEFHVAKPYGMGNWLLPPLHILVRKE